MGHWKTETDFALDRVLEILHWVFPEEIAAGDEAKRVAAEKADAIQAAELREFYKLGLSAYTANSLTRWGATDVEKLRKASDEELLKIRNFGKVSLAELRSKLEKTDD